MNVDASLKNGKGAFGAIFRNSAGLILLAISGPRDPLLDIGLLELDAVYMGLLKSLDFGFDMVIIELTVLMASNAFSPRMKTFLPMEIL